MIKGIDVSQWQGDIDWSAVKASGIEFAIIKISGGDAGLYYDTKATQNYYGVKAVSLGVGGYHFAGGGDPIVEADFFIKGMQPFIDNDVWVLDWEVEAPDPVNWCAAFMQRCHDVAGVWPLLYINGDRANRFNWNANAVLANCGKWIAWYDKDPAGTLAVPLFYTMHQYSSSGQVKGIAENVDLDMFFGDIAQFNRYGWHPPAAPPQPVVTTGQVVEYKDVPFEVFRQETDQLDVGVTQLGQAGQNGVKTLTYSVTYTDGQETGRVLLSSVVTVLPINEVTLVGTKKPVVPDPGTVIIPTPTPVPVPPVTQGEAARELKALAKAFVRLIKSLFGKKGN